MQLNYLQKRSSDFSAIFLSMERVYVTLTYTLDEILRFDYEKSVGNSLSVYRKWYAFIVWNKSHSILTSQYM